MDKSHIWGAFVDEQLAGCIGFFRMNTLKTQHRGVLWGLYIKPEYRGQRIADSLVKEIIAYAKTQVAQLHLAVVTTNETAIKLYQRHGFRINGTKPCALKIDSHCYDEHLMVLEFL